ncbi:MAG: DNA-3-methyladenine glycosylase I [Methylococcales bacterium]|nr:DNA-3-methyladenine glycosylase I [Methylococcales bacterium]
MQRCNWAGSGSATTLYHDQEWGAPQHDDRRLFEFLVLEGAQAGLSWRTILEKRDNYRIAFDHFDPEKVAAYDQTRQLVLLNNSGIVRNRLKIQAAIKNAQAFLAVQQAYGSFDAYIWGFVNYTPLQNRFHSHEPLPAFSELSIAISKDLQRRGFKFVGKTICYAFMQAIGMVNDHAVECFRHAQLGGE